MCRNCSSAWHRVGIKESDRGWGSAAKLRSEAPFVATGNSVCRPCQVRPPQSLLDDPAQLQIAMLVYRHTCPTPPTYATLASMPANATHFAPPHIREPAGRADPRERPPVTLRVARASKARPRRQCANCEKLNGNVRKCPRPPDRQQPTPGAPYRMATICPSSGLSAGGMSSPNSSFGRTHCRRWPSRPAGVPRHFRIANASSTSCRCG